MKTILIFLLGAAVGIIGFMFYRDNHQAVVSSRSESAPLTPPPPSTAPSTASTVSAKTSSVIEQARDTAVSAKDAIAQKFADWHLTPDEIKDDLTRTGRVVRSKAQAAGETISQNIQPVRIKSVINAKYVLDRDLSARAIDVESDHGKVTLRGTVASAELIARAVALALDTEGVVEVTSLLTVQP